MNKQLQIPLSNPDISNIERELVSAALCTSSLSLGPLLSVFETVMAEYAGTPYAVAMSSGTAVLHAIVRALSISKGDFVLTSAFSFISTANCLLFEGAEPIFVDIDEKTYNITPEKTEAVLLSLPPNIRRRVKAITYVDVFGVPADGEGFEKLGEKYRLHIINDSAEALGSSRNNRKCGSFGDAGVFAFYPNKQITTGEGGILATRHKDLADRCKSLRNQGRDEGAGWLQHARLGYNYRMSDINCALGLGQMNRIDELLKKRRHVKNTYDSLFFPLFDKGLLIRQSIPNHCEVSPFVYVLRLGDEFNQETRDKLLAFLRQNGIGCSNYFTPIHLQPTYIDLKWQYGDLPITEKVAERTVALPFFNNLSHEKIQTVVTKVTEFFSLLESGNLVL